MFNNWPLLFIRLLWGMQLSLPYPGQKGHLSCLSMVSRVRVSRLELAVCSQLSPSPWLELSRNYRCTRSSHSSWPPVLTDPPARVRIEIPVGILAPGEAIPVEIPVTGEANSQNYLCSVSGPTRWETCGFEITFACGGFVSSKPSSWPPCSPIISLSIHSVANL